MLCGPAASDCASSEAGAAAAAAATWTDPNRCIAWRTGMVRPAADAKQSQQYWKLFQNKHQPHQQQQQQLPPGPGAQAMLSAALLDSSTAQSLVPGLQLPALTAPGPHNQNRPPLGRPQHSSSSSAQAAVGYRHQLDGPQSKLLLSTSLVA